MDADRKFGIQLQLSRANNHLEVLDSILTMKIKQEDTIFFKYGFTEIDIKRQVQHYDLEIKQ
jgi:hypothetical protein